MSGSGSRRKTKRRKEVSAGVSSWVSADSLERSRVRGSFCISYTSVLQNTSIGKFRNFLIFSNFHNLPIFLIGINSPQNKLQNFQNIIHRHYDHEYNQEHETDSVQAIGDFGIYTASFDRLNHQKNQASAVKSRERK